MNTLAPICIFVYNRSWHTKQTIDALKSNYLSPESDLFVFSDGPKDFLKPNKVDEVRKYLKTISGFKSITIYESPRNIGLANSIITGVSKIINQYSKVIVVEDDLITSPNYLDFMNQALDFYKNHQNIISISGYSLDLPSLKSYERDYYLGYRASSWGWGTWKEKWENVDWEVKEYSKFRRNLITQFQFMRGGSDMPRMLKSQMNGHIDSWAIRWCFDQFKKNQLTVFPAKSKILSIGFGNDATHTKKTKRFNTILDDGSQRIFSFDEKTSLNSLLVREFRNKFSLYSRLKEKIF